MHGSIIAVLAWSLGLVVAPKAVQPLSPKVEALGAKCQAERGIGSDALYEYAPFGSEARRMARMQRSRCPGSSIQPSRCARWIAGATPAASGS